MKMFLQPEAIPVLDPAKVGLIEATLFPELDLAHASLLTQ